MFSKKSFLRRLFGSFFGRSSRDAAYFRKRSLQLESLEAREMLSVVGFVDTQNAIEGEKSGIFSIERDGDLSTSLTVNFTIDTDGGYDYYNRGVASSGVDYEQLPNSTNYNGSVTFGIGENQAIITISTIDDNLVESKESVTLRLVQPGGSSPSYTVDANRSIAAIEIEDNDIAPTVWLGAVQNAVEGGQQGLIGVYRDDASRALTIRYSIETNRSGYAELNNDYTGLPGLQNNYYGTLTFQKDETFISIPVTAIDDLRVEGLESITITLQEAVQDYYYYYENDQVNAYVLDASRSSATILIEDNDIAPIVWLEKLSDTAEGGESGTVRFWRNDAARSLTVSYAVESSYYEYGSNSIGAQSGTDFVALSGQNGNRGNITFDADKFFVDVSVTAIEDLLVEPTENFVIRLEPSSSSDQINAYSIDATKRSVTVLIHDNDIAPTVWLEVIQNAVEGGQQGLIRVHRNDASRDLTVRYSIDTSRSGYAEQGNDYEYLPGTEDSYYKTEGKLTFQKNETFVDIPITAFKDDLTEGSESVTITLQEAVQDYYYENDQVNTYVLDVSRSSATVLISDDESSVPATGMIVWIDSFVNAVEGKNSGKFILKRTNTEYAVQVYYSISGTAQNSTDYDALNGYVTFIAGQDTVEIFIHPKEDTTVEKSES
ncbi:MAG: hypothetical protein LBF88_01395, partial [Planctomycetaceae bacterium]|nr:hypothetical protein [Planctomycetaceae bacterium]